MNFDPNQIKRALINILENAVEAIENRRPRYHYNLS